MMTQLKCVNYSTILLRFHHTEVNVTIQLLHKPEV